MSTATTTQSKSLGMYVVYGVLAGFAGGVLFGILIGYMKMLAQIGSILGAESAFLGLIIHMVISAITGGIYGVIASKFENNWTIALSGGLIYGVFWWVIGGLILTPLFLGQSDQIFALGIDQWLLLIGYLVYGLITAFVFSSIVRD